MAEPMLSGAIHLSLAQTFNDARVLVPHGVPGARVMDVRVEVARVGAAILRLQKNRPYSPCHPAMQLSLPGALLRRLRGTDGAHLSLENDLKTELQNQNPNQRSKSSARPCLAAVLAPSDSVPCSDSEDQRRT